MSMPMPLCLMLAEVWTLILMELTCSSEFLRIARFLGEDWVNKLLENEKVLLRKVTEHSNFESMKANASKYILEGGTSEIIRKGNVGGWKDHMSEHQSHLVDEKLKEAARKYENFDKLWDKYECI